MAATRRSRSARRRPPAPPAAPAPTFVVGLGGSAGGLEAFEQFFARCPATTGMAFVVVTHLDPARKPLLPELLQRITPMPVALATDGAALVPATVVVIPPDRVLTLDGDAVRLAPLDRRRKPFQAIDAFFHSLAQARGATAIGVVLSGMGEDGAAGLRTIDDAGGLVLVQEPDSAVFASMPEAALAALGAEVDAVASPEALADRIIALTAARAAGLAAAPSVAPAPAALARVLAILRRRTGHDLGQYKTGAIERRLERRLMVHHLPSLDAYAVYLDGNPDEADLLLRELLIGVTHFFRDDEAFAVLRAQVLPALLARAGEPRSLRAWVAGCSSGEEAYSLAIVIDELLTEQHADDVQVLIYATDLDKNAIATARVGRYPAEIEARVSPARLARYFVRDDGSYRISSAIRSKVVFAQHDLISDPPFTRLDLLFCRNLLIYLQPMLQQRLLPRFHYALAPGGVLVLGAAESVASAAELFEPVDSRAKVFRRVEVVLGPRARLELPSGARPELVALRTRAPAEVTMVDAARRAIVDAVAPPTLLINPRGDILYASRRTGRYLEPAVGKTNINVLAMAREGLGAALSLAIQQAHSRRRRVRRDGLQVQGDRGRYLVDLTVVPLDEPPALRGLLLVVFEEPAPPPAGKRAPVGAKGSARAPALERELTRTRNHLQTVVRDMDAAQTQIESANEELQSANEELQSTNEELTTSREELQSLNEELLTINAELEAKIRELATSNDDLRNVVNSTRIPTLFLDRDLRIKRFTSEAARVANVIPSDVGRAITDITLRVAYPGLQADVEEVLATLVFKEIQVGSDTGATYTVRIHPYRTMDNTIDGVVITFVDISALRGAEAALAARIHEGVLARLLDRWPGLVCVHDFTVDRDVYVNDEAQAWLRAAGATALEPRFEALLHPDDAAAAAGWRARLARLTNGEVLTRPVRVRRGDGGFASFRQSESILTRAADGRPAQVLAVLDEADAGGR